jgi:hypothetical protein
MSTSNNPQLDRELLPRHRTLIKRKYGLTDETIDASGIYSVSRRGAFGLLGWKPNSGGFVIPNSFGSFRIRLDKPYAKKNGSSIKYASPRRDALFPRIYLYVPPILDLAVLRDSTIPLIVTESEMGALKATQEGYPTIATSGVESWQQDHQPLSEWFDIVVAGRLVIMAPDSDYARNRNVQRATREQAAFHRSRGAHVMAVHITDDGKSKLGLDDALIKHGPEWLQGTEHHDIPEPAPRTTQDSAPGVIAPEYWAKADVFWRDIGQSGDPVLGETVSTHLDKNKRVPGTSLIQVGCTIVVKVEGRKYKGKRDWPIPVAWFNLGVSRDDFPANSLVELSEQHLKLCDLLMQSELYALRSPHEWETTSNAVIFWLWITTWAIFQQWRPGWKETMSPVFFARLLRWDINRVKNAFNEYVRAGVFEAEDMLGKDGNWFTVYEPSEKCLAWPNEPTEPIIVDDLSGGETNINSADNDLATPCPCGCLQTLGKGRGPNVKKWAGPGCKERFWRKHRETGNDNSADNDLRSNDSAKNEVPPWE